MNFIEFQDKTKHCPVCGKETTFHVGWLERTRAPNGGSKWHLAVGNLEIENSANSDGDNKSYSLYGPQAVNMVLNSDGTIECELPLGVSYQKIPPEELQRAFTSIGFTSSCEGHYIINAVANIYLREKELMKLNFCYEDILVKHDNNFKYASVYSDFVNKVSFFYNYYVKPGDRDRVEIPYTPFAGSDRTIKEIIYKYKRLMILS